MATNFGERVARLEVLIETQSRMIESLISQGEQAAESRKRVYETQEKIEREMIHLNHRLDAVEQKVEKITPTTEEYQNVRDKVVFAGRLGRWLWATGKVLISAAAGATAYWYAMTGRPPP